MEHLLQKSKCSIFHNIFKYMIFQRHQKALLWSKGLSRNQFLRFEKVMNDGKRINEVSHMTNQTLFSQ